METNAWAIIHLLISQLACVMQKLDQCTSNAMLSLLSFHIHIHYTWVVMYFALICFLEQPIPWNYILWVCWPHDRITLSQFSYDSIMMDMDRKSIQINTVNFTHKSDTYYFLVWILTKRQTDTDKIWKRNNINVLFHSTIPCP